MEQRRKLNRQEHDELNTISVLVTTDRRYPDRVEILPDGAVSIGYFSESDPSGDYYAEFFKKNDTVYKKTSSVCYASD